jgi:hypothetical protein
LAALVDSRTRWLRDLRQLIRLVAMVAFGCGVARPLHVTSSEARICRR